MQAPDSGWLFDGDAEPQLALITDAGVDESVRDADFG
jgi:hypothetical protein